MVDARIFIFSAVALVFVALLLFHIFMSSYKTREERKPTPMEPRCLLHVPWVIQGTEDIEAAIRAASLFCYPSNNGPIRAVSLLYPSATNAAKSTVKITAVDEEDEINGVSRENVRKSNHSFFSKDESLQVVVRGKERDGEITPADEGKASRDAVEPPATSSQRNFIREALICFLIPLSLVMAKNEVRRSKVADEDAGTRAYIRGNRVSTEDNEKANHSSFSLEVITRGGESEGEITVDEKAKSRMIASSDGAEPSPVGSYLDEIKEALLYSVIRLSLVIAVRRAMQVDED